MKKFLFGLFVGCFCSICGFYVVSRYIPQKMQDFSHVEKSAVEKPALPRPVKKEGKKVSINGCAIKDNSCTCYAKDGTQLNPSVPICEKYIKNSGGSQFIVFENPEFIGSNPESDARLQDILKQIKK